MTTDYEKEMQQYIGFSKEKKMLWLSYLIFEISMDSRYYYCYSEKNENADKKAIILSDYLELLHRVASFQISVDTKQKYTIPDEVFFQDLYSKMKLLGIKPDVIFNDIRTWINV